MEERAEDGPGEAHGVRAGAWRDSPLSASVLAPGLGSSGNYQAERQIIRAIAGGGRERSQEGSCLTGQRLGLLWQGMSWTRGFSDNGECGIMKLHETLRKVIRQFGTNVLSEKRLLFTLSDYRAFEEYPALKQVFEAIVSTGAGKELMRLSLDDDREGCISYAQNLKKSLSEQGHFREDLAGCAVDSILFALGLTDTVTEPSDHGFDAVEHGSGAGGRDAGARTGGSRAEERDAVNVSSGGSGAGAAGERPRVSPENDTQKTPGGSTGTQVSGGVHLNAAGKGSSKSMKWAVAAVLVAGIICGWLASSLMNRQNSGTAQQAAYSSSVQGRDGDAKSGDDGAGEHSGQYAHADGKAYSPELQVISDSPEEVQRLRQSAEQGDASAQCQLGMMYTQGLGGSRDDAEAVRWFRKSAEQGDAYGQLALGLMYAHGTGVEKDYSEAAKWYRKSAGQGLANAEAGLGMLYALGLGVSRDDAEAVKLLRKAADQGDAGGEAWLGIMYARGLGTDRDYAKAAQWLRRSADQGNAFGQYNLGFLYEYGLGVGRDYDEALRWYRKAAAQGDKNAQNGIERVEKLIQDGSR